MLSDKIRVGLFYFGYQSNLTSISTQIKNVRYIIQGENRVSNIETQAISTTAIKFLSYIQIYIRINMDRMADGIMTIE